jgi:hypothetical protein
MKPKNNQHIEPRRKRTLLLSLLLLASLIVVGAFALYHFYLDLPLCSSIQQVDADLQTGTDDEEDRAVPAGHIRLDAEVAIQVDQDVPQGRVALFTEKYRRIALTEYSNSNPTLPLVTPGVYRLTLSDHCAVYRLDLRRAEGVVRFIPHEEGFKP